MEAAMYKSLATIAGVLAILCGALLVSDSAQAGASASAASKNQHMATQQQGQINRTAGRNDFGITEYSSSSARNRTQR
jgi:hypothetical protein